MQIYRNIIKLYMQCIQENGKFAKSPQKRMKKKMN